MKAKRERITVKDMEAGRHQAFIQDVQSGPDLKRSKEIVRSLQRLHLETVDFDYLKLRVMHLMHAHVIASTTSNVHEPIYRAVRWSELPQNVVDLGCPPSERVPLGRANRQNSPVFYGSAGCHSTILELAPNLGDRLVISKWRTRSNLTLVCAGYSAEVLQGKSGLNRCESLPWVTQHAADSLSKKPGNQLVHRFIAREFTKTVPHDQPWRYKISAAISDVALNALSFEMLGNPRVNIAGIVYPSSPNEANADNVALKPEVATEQLEFVCVQYIEITQKTNAPAYSMHGLNFADTLSADGRIEWQNRFPENLIAGSDHTFEFLSDKVVILDNKGEVVGSALYDQQWGLVPIEASHSNC